MHMARLWDSSRRSYSLANLSADLLDPDMCKTEMKELFGRPVLKKDGSEGKKIELPPVELLQRMPDTRPDFILYSAQDAVMTWHLHDVMQHKLKAMKWAEGKSMLDFYTKYLVGFGEMLTDMERIGVPVAVEKYLPEIEAKAKADHSAHMKRFVKWSKRVMGEDAERLNL